MKNRMETAAAVSILFYFLIILQLGEELVDQLAEHAFALLVFGFDIFAMKDEDIMSHWRVYSVGGGTFQIEGKKVVSFEEVYKETCFKEIKEYCIKNNCELFDYVVKNEGEEIYEFLFKRRSYGVFIFNNWLYCFFGFRENIG